MPDIDVTSIDLAAGLKVKNIVVPPMVVDVVLKNASADLQKALKDDKVVIQKIAMAAFEVLNKAKKAFQDAAGDLDDGYDKKPPADVAEAEERVRTFNTVCKQIAEAQGQAATKAAEAEWTNQARKNKELTKYDGLFALRIVLGVVAVAASLVHTIMSFGATSALAIVSIAKTCVSMTADIYNHCREMAKTEADIIETDETLEKTWADPEITAGKVGRELAAALGAPVVKSIGGFGKLLTEYDAKIARKDKLADKLYDKAKEMMKAIDKASAKAGPEMQKKLANLGKKVDGLLSEVGDISAGTKKCDAFSATYQARLKIYEAMRGAKLGKVATGTGIALLAGGAVSTAETIVEIAVALA